jgi:hypothetical protein
MPVIGVRGTRELAGWLGAVAIIVLLAVGCGGADDSAEAPANDFSSTTTAPRTSAGPAPPPGHPGPPTVEAPGLAPPSDFEVVDQAIEGLITRNATWQAPPSLQVNKTENVALSIGDVQSLQEEITRTVPTVLPREPQPIEIGSRVSASLTVGAQDATVAPLEAIDKSIGELTSIMFSWQVTPLRAGELILSAHIKFPLTDEYEHTQIVPLRIPVTPAEQVKQPWTSTFLDVIKNYWVQLTTAGGVLLAGARFGWGWYKRRRNVPAAAAAEEDSASEGVKQPGAMGQPDTPEAPGVPAKGES